MNDTISRSEAIDALCRGEGCGNICRRALERLPPAQQKKLKYSGESICIHCQTKVCDGCLLEPMEGVMNG